MPVNRDASIWANYDAGKVDERKWTIEFLQKLVKVEQESNPSGPIEKAMSGYVIGELEGIIEVIKGRS